MQRCAFTPYEGNEPYIFISYAHKDSKRVYPILEELNRRGYRVWYDDGIAPGSEWPENIAQHLSGCALTLAFISPSSIASDNCRREVTFALSKRKPFLGIILEPTEMSLGMEMQLSAQQCIMKYSYATDESFYHKVCSCPDLQPCLKPAPKEEPLAPAPVAPAPVPAPQPKPAAPKQPTKPLDKKMIGIIAGAAAAVVLLAVILIGVFSGGNDPENPAGSTGSSQSQTESQPRQEETVLRYEDVTVTADTVAQIKENSALQELHFIGCSFETDLTFLRDLAGLRSLTLNSCGVTDATLPSLALPELESLDISGNTGITDVTPLAGLTKLKALNAADCVISVIAEPFQCLRLEELNLANNRIEDIGAFENCTILTHVDLSYTGVQDVDFLAKSAATLQMVNLSGNEDLYDWDLKFLADCTAIRALYLDGTRLYDPDFLTGLATLEQLSANACHISDISFVSGLTKLNYLSLAANTFTDITALSSLGAEGLVLDLGMANFITDLSALPVGHYKLLNIMGGSVDLSTLPAVSGDCLVMVYSDDIASNAVLKDDPFAEYFLLECPVDKIVAMENLFGIEEVLAFNTLEEYCLILEALEMDYRYLIEAAE